MSREPACALPAAPMHGSRFGAKPQVCGYERGRNCYNKIRDTPVDSVWLSSSSSGGEAAGAACQCYFTDDEKAHAESKEAGRLRPPRALRGGVSGVGKRKDRRRNIVSYR